MKKKDDRPQTYLCYICGKEISGDHVFIRTRRRTDLHIHLVVCRRERKGERHGRKELPEL